MGGPTDTAGGYVTASAPVTGGFPAAPTHLTGTGYSAAAATAYPGTGYPPAVYPPGAYPQGVVYPAAAPPAPAAPVWGGLGSRPLFGLQTGFVQVRQPAFWLYVGLLAVTAMLALSEQSQFISALPTAYFFSWILLAIWVVPVVVAIYTLDIFEREPLSLLAAAFVWGAVVATALAEPTNTAMFEIVFKLFGKEATQQWGAAVSGPPIEETLKLCGVVLIFLIARTEIDDLFDGFIYGAMVGLGFATVENVLYFIRAAAGVGAGGDQIGAVFNIYLLRVIFSGQYMHMLWTGLTGVGLAYAITRTDLPRGRRIMGAAAMFAVGIAAHFVWNSPFLTSLLAGNPGPLQMILFGVFKGLPFFGFLVVLVFLSQRREAMWFQGAVAPEVLTGTLTSEDVAEITNLRRRWAARRQASTYYGPAAGKLVGRIQREETTLAMIRARVTDEAAPELVRQRALIVDLKTQLAVARATPRPGRPASGVPQQPPSAMTILPGQAPFPGQPTPTFAPSQGAPMPSPPVTPSVPVASVPGTPALVPMLSAIPPVTGPVPGSTPSTTPLPDSAMPGSAPKPDSAPIADPVAFTRAPLADKATRQPDMAPPTPPQAITPTWTPTHVVPDSGTLAWPVPDPRYPPILNLAPRAELQVVESAGGWYRVAAANGWTGWVDSRQLIPRTGLS